MSFHHTLHQQRAAEALAGAEAEWDAGRHNNAVGRVYYYLFHLTVAVRIARGERTDTLSGRWEHQKTWWASDECARRQGRPELVGEMGQVYAQRKTSDYDSYGSSRDEAEETIKRAKALGEVLASDLPQ